MHTALYPSLAQNPLMALPHLQTCDWSQHGASSPRSGPPPTWLSSLLSSPSDLTIYILEIPKACICWNVVGGFVPWCLALSHLLSLECPSPFPLLLLLSTSECGYHTGVISSKTLFQISKAKGIVLFNTHSACWLLPWLWNSGMVKGTDLSICYLGLNPTDLRQVT